MFSKVATILVAASAFLLRAYAAPTVEARQEIFAGDGTNDRILSPLYYLLTNFVSLQEPSTPRVWVLVVSRTLKQS